MTTVVIGNPIRNIRAIIDQIFQGIENLFFPKEGGEASVQNDPKAKGIDAFREIKEPHKYLQKGGIKQMCNAEPYEVEHAYGLVYDYEEEKVAPSFSGKQFQVYLERATELCDEDPECKYFNLWTDGGITKYRECDSLKDTINSTITYEKMPLPPVPGTECEDKGFKPYDWYDFKRNKVSLSTGAGEANSEWDENGKCTRVSCKNAETEELNELRQCVPTTVEALSDKEQRERLEEMKGRQEDVDNANAKIQKIKELKDACKKHWNDSTYASLTSTGHFLTELKWNPSGQGYNLTWSGDCDKFANMEYERSYSRKNNYNQYFDGFADEWDGPNDAAAGWW